MIRWPIAFVGISLVIGFAAPSARAALVTYDFVDVITFGGRQFTGSFTYDTVTTVVSNANLQSSGDPTENWVATNFTTFNGNTFYDGAPIIDFGIDLTFASQSALFPASDDGDIVGFTFYNPLDGVPNSLDGVSGDAVVASYEYTAGPFPGSTGFLFAAEIATGCVAPAGVSIIVGGGPGTPTCALAGASIPEPSSLALLTAGVVCFSASRGARPRRPAALRRLATRCWPDGTKRSGPLGV